MTRTETTKFLGKLLTDTRLGGAGSHWASEVSIDPWTPKARRVDYMEFSPANQCSVSGIEKGIFTCYEIKSCKEDVYSGTMIIGISIRPFMYPNTMFLTEKEAREHLKRNYYHYSEDAHTYCMVAWRSPEVEKLWKILRETKWDCKDKELESHEEKYILHYCISLMQELVGCFEEWYRWVHGENAIEELSEEERFCYNMSYFHIVQELFLFRTYHSGGTSTMAKCRQLGVDSGDNIEFKFSEGEKDDR